MFTAHTGLVQANHITCQFYCARIIQAIIQLVAGINFYNEYDVKMLDCCSVQPVAQQSVCC